MLAQILVKLPRYADSHPWQTPVFTLSMFARIAAIPRTQQQRYAMARKAKQKTSETPEPMIIGDDCVVAFHYKLCEILADGSKSGWLEESTGRQPLLYLHGHSNVISGLEQAMSGKKAGDTLEITLAPEQAYGPRRSNSLLRVPIKHLHLPAGNKSLVPGTVVGVQTDRGVRSALVVKAGRFNVDIDTNHPFAGRTLHYQLEIVSVRAATPEEITHRHAHGEGGHHH
jgi:FKBP-type peptidyl-prolyl cis-trans isomerase SlyD